MRDPAGHLPECAEPLLLNQVSLRGFQFPQRFLETSIAFLHHVLGPFALDDVLGRHLAHRGEAFLLDEMLLGGLEPHQRFLQTPVAFLHGVFRSPALDDVRDDAREQRAVHLFLRERVLRAGADGVDRNRLIIGSGEDEDGDVGNALTHAGDGFNPLAIRECQVQQDGIDAADLKTLQTRGEPVGPFDVKRGVAQVGERFTNERGEFGTVFHLQELNSGYRHRRSPPNKIARLPPREQTPL